MKLSLIAPIGLCLALGACASRPPTEPARVAAIAGEHVSDKNFARDDAACRARTKSVTDQEAAAGEPRMQTRYDHLYADCMMSKGYDIEAQRRAYYGPGPYYGPGSYYAGYGPGYYGPAFFYGGGWGRRW